jgi:hypothetical protein
MDDAFNASDTDNAGSIEVGATYTFTVEGTFDDSGNLALDFTVDDGSHSQTFSSETFAPSELDGDYFGIIGDTGETIVRVSSFSVVNVVPPPLSSSAVYDFGTDPGKIAAEDAGFTTSTPAGTEAWSLRADSVRYAFGGVELHTASLLRSFNLDRSEGQSYTFEGILDFTAGYGDDNNRIGMLLFNETESQTVDGGGGLYLQLNTDGRELSIADGINGVNGITTGLPSTSASGAYSEDGWVGTTLKYTADIVFTNDLIDVAFTFADQNGVENTLRAEVYAENYPGTYFGFATKLRNRGDSYSNRDDPPVLNYKSFSFTDNTLQGYDLWASEHGVGAATDDFDSDGINNLYEYGLGGDPTNPAVHGTLPTFSTAESVFTYSYPKRSDDDSLIYTVQTTTNLVVGPWVETGVFITETEPGDPLDRVTATVDSTADGKFIRLKIEQK